MLGTVRTCFKPPETKQKNGKWKDVARPRSRRDALAEKKRNMKWGRGRHPGRLALGSDSETAGSLASDVYWLPYVFSMKWGVSERPTPVSGGAGSGCDPEMMASGKPLCP